MTYLLSNIAKLYDGSSSDKRALHAQVDVLVENGRISSVAPHDPQRPKSEGIVVVDCTGMTVTPGIIDCHGHITLLGTTAPELEKMNSLAAPYYIEKILYTTLVNGAVTTMRDVGGATHFMKRMVEEGVLIGPRLKIAVCLLSTTGGVSDYRGLDRCHGDLSKLFPPIAGRPSSIVDGVEACRQRVREVIACGADLIKFCASGGVVSPTSTLDSRAFTPAEVEAICDEAHARGVRVAAHAHSKSGIEMAIDNGADDLQHISFMDERLVEKAHKANCTVTPTSWVLAEVAANQALPQVIKDKVKRAIDAHQGAVQFSSRGGLKILAGSDPIQPGMHGKNFMEIAYLIRDGLAPLSAWHGATGLAATEIGQTDTGEIKPGKRADLLVCKSDVIENPETMASGALVEVLKDGVGYRNGLPQITQRSFPTL